MKTIDLLTRVRQGDPMALAKAITMVENRKKDYKSLLAGIYPLPGKALKIGITGAPGCGKSSLIEKMIAVLKAQGVPIAVLAVDPSSPFTGGALLGDRLRMIQHSNDANVFIRSIANRGQLGGLSLSTHEIVDLLIAAGMEIILIETVGVGQSEVDIVNVADMVLMVLNPDSGDEIQIFKAGIIEIADIFVINKADLGGSDNKISEIKNYFATAARSPLIIPTSVKEDRGIPELLAAIQQFQREECGRIDKKRANIKRNYVEKIVAERVREEMRLNSTIEDMLKTAATANPVQLAEAIFQKIKAGGSDDKKN
ncbi:MAG: methylmalonyl Co-A mutase-associated GTPase MeaB [Candidatus Aminicenantes bacterium]|nr:methylmalonyl Co-A mutase-associated GTPase MeaB [Acidobacteriota bacterium]MCG2812266.1 methylmalonyl Co-A mutase-associated GTPase MeaB [Candidatus Aminicenantes bacterium]